MKFRSAAVSTLCVGLVACTVMALRAADDKKAKEDDVPPSPGTIKFSTAPVAVQKTFAAETKNAKIELLGKAEDGSFYMAVVGIGTNVVYNYRMAVAKDGQLMEKVLEPFRVEVKLEDCPAPVQKGLKDEAKGAKIEGITRVAAAKHIEFVFDVTLQNTPYQLIFTDDGSLLSKIRDEEEQSDTPAPKGKTETTEKPTNKQRK